MVEQQLIKQKYPKDDLFICDVADAVLKDIMPQMEHPFYSLSKKPETSIRRYEHNGSWIEVTPSVKGLATIYDKDILIYAISQIMEKLNRGEEVSPRVPVCQPSTIPLHFELTSKYKAVMEVLNA